LTARDIMWVYEHPKRHFPFYSQAAVLADRVVVGGRDKMVHCLNTKTGEPHWTYMTRARVESSPVIAGNRVYVGSNDGRFYVFDLTTGDKLWEFLAGSALTASPAIAGGRIVIGAIDGVLYCFGE
ncbi:MAG: PQQ-binding-like beta-propeller repeat protein, partial [bacterium]|nr:PQQ-binding-like beta-propeller repeat protein [bacterium]